MNVPAPLSAPTIPAATLSTGALSPGTDPIDSKFDFFKLPAELRNDIYSRLYEEVQGLHGSRKYRMTVPLVALRLISREFKREYDGQSFQNELTKQLVIKGRRVIDEDEAEDEDEDEEEVYDARMKDLPGLTSHATSMIAVIPACGCEGPSKFACTTHPFHWDQHYFTELATHFFKKLRWAHIYLTVATEKCARAILRYLNSKRMHYGTLAHFACDSNSEIYKVTVLYPGCEFIDDGDGDNKALATWTAQGGLEIHDQAIEQKFQWTSREQMRMEYEADEEKHRTIARSLGLLP